MIDDFFAKARPDIDRQDEINRFNRESAEKMSRRAEQSRAEKQRRELERWQERAQRLARDESSMESQHLIDLEIAQRRARYAVVSQVLWGALVFVIILAILIAAGGVL